jgi:hypothetical protein
MKTTWRLTTWAWRCGTLHGAPHGKNGPLRLRDAARTVIFHENSAACGRRSRRIVSHQTGKHNKQNAGT